MATLAEQNQIATSGSSLAGTLSADAGRTLPESEDQLVKFKDALRQVALVARSQTRPTVAAELGRYAQAGVKLTNPGAISAGLQAGTLGRREVEGSVYSGVVDLLKQQEDRLSEQQRANSAFASNFMGLLTSNPTLFSQITGADLESLKKGVVTTELMQRIGQVAASTPGSLDTQVVTAGGRQLLINTQTGETIKDLGGAYKEGGGGSSSDKEQKAFLSDLADLGYKLAADPTIDQDLAIQSLATQYGVSSDSIKGALGLSSVSTDTPEVSTEIGGGGGGAWGGGTTTPTVTSTVTPKTTATSSSISLSANLEPANSLSGYGDWFNQIVDSAKKNLGF